MSVAVLEQRERDARVELTQGIVPIDRAATTHDVMFNVLGGFVGAVAGAFVAHAVHHVSRTTDTSVR